MSSPTRTNPLSFLSTQLDDLKAKGTYFQLRVLEDEQEPVCTFDGRKVINLASNNYLGLTTHPKLREAAQEATRKYGVGSGAVRTIAGTMKIHMELEEKIARFKNVEACVVFQSGFTANAGTVSAILGKEDFIITDALNHASIIDGCRLSRAKILVFRHKDIAHAEEQLKSVEHEPGKKLLITDGVFSMDGDIGPLPELCDLAEKYGAIMMVDDAHASGVLGRNGRGTIDHFKVHGRVDIQVGTLSKAIGALGGYVCGSRDFIDFLYHRARPFVFYN
jgi:glycine C-acetyltransferase